MVAEVTPTNEEYQAHLLEIVERVDEEDRPALLEHHTRYYTYEKYCWEQNRFRNEILEIVKAEMYGSDEDFKSIVDEMSDDVAELIINLSSHADELETNLQEFYDIDMPEVWAI